MIAGGNRGHEPFECCLLLGPVHQHPRPSRRHVLAGTVRDLPDSGRRLAHDLCDLVVWRLEHLVQYEHGPLDWSKGLEHRQ